MDDPLPYSILPFNSSARLHTIPDSPLILHYTLRAVPTISCAQRRQFGLKSGGRVFGFENWGSLILKVQQMEARSIHEIFIYYTKLFYFVKITTLDNHHFGKSPLWNHHFLISQS